MTRRADAVEDDRGAFRVLGMIEGCARTAVGKGMKAAAISSSRLSRSSTGSTKRR